MARVFISYRRSDTDADAGRLFSDLAAVIGEDSLFKDVDHVPLGADVEEHIRAAIAASVLIIVIVGPKWQPERLHDEIDWVRLEIEAAFEKGIPILPVRVRRAELPKPSEVPVSLHKFCRLNAAELEHASWRRDLPPVLDVVQQALATGKIGTLPGDVVDAEGPHEVQLQTATQPQSTSRQDAYRPPADLSGRWVVLHDSEYLDTLSDRGFHVKQDDCHHAGWHRVEGNVDQPHLGRGRQCYLSRRDGRHRG